MYLRKIQQNAAKMVPKSSQNDPKMDPKMTTKIDPGRIPGAIWALRAFCAILGSIKTAALGFKIEPKITLKIH